jgi:hypothetical protein
MCFFWKRALDRRPKSTILFVHDSPLQAKAAIRKLDFTDSAV